MSSEQLFAPITTATKDVKTATERAMYGNIREEGEPLELPVLGVLEKIAAETEKKTQKGKTELSGDIKTQREYARLAHFDVCTENQEVSP